MVEELYAAFYDELYGMMQRIKELSGGRLVMGPGTLYGVLSRMSREGLIVRIPIYRVA